jgi:hypothetical protein
MDKSVYYKPIHFKTQEYIPPETYNVWGEQSLMFMDSRLLWSMDQIWEYFQKLKPGCKITINDWLWGGQFSHRGYRPITYQAEGAKDSQHRHGRACDYDVLGYTAEQVRQIILANQINPIFQYVTTFERGVTWVHMDVRNVDKSKGITLVTP